MTIFLLNFERQRPSHGSVSIFPAYCCNSSGNTAWNQPVKIGFQAAAQLPSCQQIECRVTNIQYLLIRSPRLLLFSVNTEWLSPLIPSFVLFLIFSSSLLFLHPNLHISSPFSFFVSPSFCPIILLFSPSSIMNWLHFWMSPSFSFLPFILLLWSLNSFSSSLSILLLFLLTASSV